MEFDIACETFARLSNIVRRMKDNENRDYLSYLWVERKAGNLIAITSNSMISALELIGTKQIGPDEGCYVKFDPALIDVCKSEAKFNSRLNVVSNDAFKFTSAKTMFGYAHKTNLGHFPDEPSKLERWREWMPDQLPEKSYGLMQFHGDWLCDFVAASPSGKVMFSEHVDTRIPIIARDLVEPNWFGFIMASMGETTVRTHKFDIPKW